MSEDTAHTAEVTAYLDRLYDGEKRAFACRARTPEELDAWQEKARPTLRHLLGLEEINLDTMGHEVCAELDPDEDLGEYTRQKGRLQTEPGVWVPFYLLRPKGEGPFPLALTPHGHECRDGGPYAGIPRDADEARKIEEQDRDVAVQAVRRGFVAIAPATRGLGTNGVPDIDSRYGAACVSQLMHVLLAGRTPLGERVWDVECLIDWGLENLEVHPKNLLVLGNSGGGMVATFAASCNERIQIAVANCSFSYLVRPDGRISHHPCNMVPGLLRFGEFYDVAGLIAPRPLLLVHGRNDALHKPAYVDAAVTELRRIYAAASAENEMTQRYGEGGHRFYADLIWTFVEEIIERNKYTQ